MHVRELKVGEEQILWELFRSTIRNVNVRDYTESQVHAWAPDDFDSTIWTEKMQSIGPFVVDVEGEIVGYSDLQPAGLIDHLFVHHQWQRRGVGRTLMSEIERRASRSEIPHLETHASITARPFFEAFSFTVVREQVLELRGEKLTNYVMQRRMQRI